MDSPIADNISTRVTNELLNDPRTHDYTSKIEVAADRGIVTLSGLVPNTVTSQIVEEIARKTQGVVSVVNELKI
ncbi:MAG TPA: BON domain-containing protein, partial [Anaerolineales bacterium]